MTNIKRKKAKRKSRQRQRTFGFSRTPKPGKKLGRKFGRKFGRKPGKDSGVTHSARATLKTTTPVHITLKCGSDLPTLRDVHILRELNGIFRTVNRTSWLRIIDYSVQHDHVHMICEVRPGRTCDRQKFPRTLSLEETLGREMQGLQVRIANKLNTMWGRRGTVFPDRYHREDLTSPSKVRNAIRYVLQNIFRHSSKTREEGMVQPDRFSSGAWFTGWEEPHLRVSHGALVDAPVCEPETWLLSVGWKLLGLISIKERPAGT